jgi:hypothetical protein
MATVMAHGFEREVSIKRDAADFVVAFEPDDVTVFRNESARALRKLCRRLRWLVVKDVPIEAHDPATW